LASIDGGRPSAIPELVIGLGVVAIGAVVLVDTWNAPAAPSYAQVGPAAFPYGIGALVVLLGGLLCLTALKSGSWRDPGEEAGLGNPHWRGLAWVVLGLVLNLALIGWLGFVLASTLLFACVARGFSSTRPLRDLAIGFVLALLAYLGFAKVLAIKLGEGLLERLF
jgi:putative tricarboxylic transport membrane protein